MEYKVYKSKYKGKQIDDAISKIPQNTPAEDSVIVVGSTGTSTYKAVSEIGGGDIKNLEDGSGASAIQQKQDGTSGTVDYTNKNANATKLDPTITGQIPYGATGNFSASFGGKSVAQGKRSLAEGTATLAKGAYSHAEGDNSVAIGDQSHVEGYATTAQGVSSHAEGVETVTQKTKYEPSSELGSGGGGSGSGGGTGSSGEIIDPNYSKNDTKCGEGAHSEGYASVSAGFAAHTEGGGTIANGHFSHAEGDSSRAQGNASHAEGGWCSANGDFSSAHGYHTNANTKGSATFGLKTESGNEYEVVVGKYNKYVDGSLFSVGWGPDENTRQTAFTVDNKGKVKAYNIPVDGDDVIRKIDVATNFKDGSGTSSINQIQDGTTGTFDFTDKNPNATALDPTLTGQISYGGTGAFSTAFGGKSQASGKRSFAAGTSTIAKGSYSAAFGDNSVTLGNESAAFGYSTVAKGDRSAAFGEVTVAEGESSFAEGTGNIIKAEIIISPEGGDSGGGGGVSPTPTPDTWNPDEHIGNSAHVEGRGNIAYGVASHAENKANMAYGHYSHVGGDGSRTGNIVNGKIVGGKGSFAHGTLNEVDGNNTAVFGSTNKAAADNSFVAGYKNELSSSAVYSASFGDQNIINSAHGFTVGSRNTLSGENSVAFGYNNVVNYIMAMVAGVGLEASTNASFVCGAYNKTNPKAKFQVGNGTNGRQLTAFEVLSDGRAKVAAAPTENDDVVRKLELDKKQNTLVSGTNIKTINGNSILGSGDLVISSGDVTAAGNNIFTGANTFTVPDTFGATTASEGVTILPSVRSPGQEYLKLGFISKYPAIKARDTANMKDCVFRLPTTKASGTYNLATTSDIPTFSFDASTATLSITLNS